MDCLTEAYKTTKFGNLYRFNVTSGRRMESFGGKKKQFSFSKVIMACSFPSAHSIDLLYYISERERTWDKLLIAFFGFCHIKKSWNLMHITKRFDSNFCVLSSCRIPIRQSNTIRVSEKRNRKANIMVIFLSLKNFRIFVFWLFLLVLHKSSPLTSFNNINANNSFNNLIVKHTQILGRLYTPGFQTKVVWLKVGTIGFSPIFESCLQAAVTVRCIGLRPIKLASQDLFTVTSSGA